MNWDDGRMFLAVARAGQMLAAARKLGVNQSTLSRRVSALEADIGSTLVIRRTHGCELTPEGAALATALEQAESAIVSAQAELGGRDAEAWGTVRIGAPDGFGVAFLAPRIGALAHSHPGLAIQLVPVPRSFSLSKREADIAVMIGRPERGQLIARKLTDYSLGLYAAPDYLDRFGVPSEAGELAEHRLVGYVEDLIYAPSLNYADEFFKGWSSAIEISSAIGQGEAVRAGAGIGVLHDYIAAGDAGLVRVLPDISVTRSYWMAYHESLRGVARVQAAAQFLTEAVKSAEAQFVAS